MIIILTNQKELNMVLQCTMVILEFSNTLDIPCKKYFGSTIELYIVQMVILWYFEKYNDTENYVT